MSNPKSEADKETSTTPPAKAKRKKPDRSAYSKKMLAAAERGDALPEFKQKGDGNWILEMTSTRAYCEMFGDTTLQFANAIAKGCANVSGSKEGLEEDKNDALAIVAEIQPQDGIEAMLATQMASVHIAAMRTSRLMAQAETIQQLDVHERVFNKLTRTFTAQMEALRKHHHGGEQKMTVEQVTVNNGGQAIVGSVSKGGGK